MKKEVILVLMVLVLMVKIVSADYVCKDNTLLTENLADLKFGDKKNTNGLVIGLAGAEYQPVIKRMDAVVLVDAQEFTLTNDTPSLYGQFSDDVAYNISLVNSTYEEAAIKQGSETKTLIENETSVIGGVSVFLLNAEGDYPGEPNVQGLVGKSSVNLSNKEEPIKIVEVDKKYYLLEIISASDYDALIKVRRCLNASVEIIEGAITETTPEPEENTTTTNETSTANESSNNENETVNTSSNGVLGQEGANPAALEEAGKTNIFLMVIIGVGVTIVVFIGISLFMSYRKNRLSEEAGIWKGGSGGSS